jgi:hypothetical protein
LPLHIGCDRFKMKNGTDINLIFDFAAIISTYLS